MFANHGIEVQGYAHDTMLQSYVLEVHKPHGLASLAERHLGRSGINYEDLCGKGAHQIPFNQVDIAKAAEYSCEDSDQTLDVHRVLWPQLQADDKLRFIYELEMHSSETLYRIERNGVLIDAPMLATQSHELGQRILQLETEAYEIAGQPFNLGSPKQIGEIFFDKLGLPVVKKTAQRRAQHRRGGAGKAGRRLPAAGQAAGAPRPVQAQGHLHRQAGPAGAPAHRPRAHALRAGRGRDRAPVQQRPQPAEHPGHARAEGRRVREAFVAPAGSVIASADYSQIELRIMAHISGDEALLRAFTDGLDVHRATAAEVFGVDAGRRSAASSAATPRSSTSA